MKKRFINSVLSPDGKLGRLQLLIQHFGIGIFLPLLVGAIFARALSPFVSSELWVWIISVPIIVFMLYIMIVTVFINVFLM